MVSSFPNSRPSSCICATAARCAPVIASSRHGASPVAKSGSQARWPCRPRKRWYCIAPTIWKCSGRLLSCGCLPARRCCARASCLMAHPLPAAKWLPTLRVWCSGPCRRPCAAVATLRITTPRLPRVAVVQSALRASTQSELRASPQRAPSRVAKVETDLRPAMTVRRFRQVALLGQTLRGLLTAAEVCPEAKCRAAHWSAWPRARGWRSNILAPLMLSMQGPS
mmetsp:Transcript_75997/g.211101  ORF Transcript_75997/g.211101 Transcript_75997/m.211101 type:complete len:224 (+) Transcript_75997:701-1372(+)